MNKLRLLKILYSIQIVSAFFVTSVQSEETKINLPVLIPLTGSAAEQGQWIREGVILAQEEFNQTSPIKMEAVFEDSQADPKHAISAYLKLKSRHSFPAVLTYGSGVGVAMSSITNSDKIIQMGLATASPAYRSANDFTFRNFPSADVEAEFSVDSMINILGANEIAIINIQNEYGVATKNAVKNLYLAKGGKILFEEEIEPNGTSYQSLILKLKSKKLKYIYLAVYPLEGAIFIKQAREMGLKSVFIAGPAVIGSRKFMEIAKESAEGLIVSTSYPVFMRSNTENATKFRQAYLKKFNEQVNIQHMFAARAYDAFLILADGIKKCGNSDSECLKKYLYEVKEYDGVSGSLSFDNNGDVSSRFELDIIKGGMFVPMQ